MSSKPLKPAMAAEVDELMAEITSRVRLLDDGETFEIRIVNTAGALNANGTVHFGTTGDSKVTSSDVLSGPEEDGAQKLAGCCEDSEDGDEGNVEEEDVNIPVRAPPKRTPFKVTLSSVDESMSPLKPRASSEFPDVRCIVRAPEPDDVGSDDEEEYEEDASFSQRQELAYYLHPSST